MAGGSFFPTGGGGDDPEDPHEGHAVQWLGTPGIKGPKWAKVPLLTVGMLGIQCVWSIEMGYASPYLLELGLSKSWMSLVFMAGPLSGLIVQPLIGIFADRSTSRWGRRRPYMLAGIGICAFAMMLLGWAKSIGETTRSPWLGIGLAVWSIYLIDFSINAAMSTDRALIVDTLPSSQQEEGSAWAGRMFGLGSVVGFFVGNLDLVPYLSFLGGTQIQILSFITSAILVVCHLFTSWAVTERVLLRDDRPQSKTGLWSSLKAIWDNMFSLSSSMQTICIIQFFSFLGWFPTLFFTTVWVSEIYKASTPRPEGMDDATWEADAVRTGARALFLQSLVNIACSVGLPFLVGESGVMSHEAIYGYAALNGNGNVNGGLPPGTPDMKRWREVSADGGWLRRIGGMAMEVIRTVKRDGVQIPIKGLTLVRLWYFSMFVFAACMACTWFVSTVSGSYVLISSIGFCWAMAQWAPYSLLGELILIEGNTDRNSLQVIHARSSEDIENEISLNDLPSRRSLSGARPESSLSARAPSPLHSRHPSRNSLDRARDDPRPSAADKQKIFRLKTPDHSRNSSIMTNDTDSTLQDTPPERSKRFLALGSQLKRGGTPMSEGETSLVLHHSDDEDDPPRPPSPFAVAAAAGKENTADKAGVILGIHNVYIVLPQFVITLLASIIFYLMEPDKGLPAEHPNAPIPIPGDFNATDAALDGMIDDYRRGLLLGREGGIGGDGAGPDAVGLIFRIGGVAAFIGGIITYRLSRRWARGEVN